MTAARHVWVSWHGWLTYCRRCRLVRLRNRATDMRRCIIPDS